MKVKRAVINQGGTKDFIFQLDGMLGQLEVKGESVMILSQVRGRVKALFDAIEEEEIEVPDTEEKKEG